MSPTVEHDGHTATSGWSGPKRWLGKIGKGLLAVVFVSLVGGGITVAQTAPTAEASTHMFGPLNNCLPLPDRSGNWVGLGSAAASEAMLLTVGVSKVRENPGDYTVLEILHGRGLSYSTFQYKARGEGGGKADCQLVQMWMSEVANGALRFNDQLVGIIVLVQTLATSSDGLFAPLYSMAASPAKRLTNNLFKPMLPIAFMLLGIWIALLVFSSRDRSREAFTNLAWACGLGLLLVVLMTGTRYADSLRAVDEGVSTVSAGLSEIILNGDRGSGACQARGTNAGSRGVTCLMWETLAFTPWVQGQYGQQGANPIPYSGEDYTGGRMKDDARWQQVWLQTYAVNDDVGTIASKWINWNTFAQHTQQMAGEGATSDATEEERTWALVYDTWRGLDGVGRVVIAVNSVSATVIGGLTSLFLSVMVLVWQLVPIMLMAVLPIAATISLFPNQRKYILGWGEALAKTYALRVVFGIGLALMLLLIREILRMKMPLPITQVLLVVGVIGLFSLIKIGKKNLPPKFSGAVGSEGGGGAAGMKQSARGAATGAVSGGPMGALQGATGSGGGSGGLLAALATGFIAGGARKGVQKSRDAAAAGKKAARAAEKAGVAAEKKKAPPATAATPKGSPSGAPRKALPSGTAGKGASTSGGAAKAGAAQAPDGAGRTRAGTGTADRGIEPVAQTSTGARKESREPRSDGRGRTATPARAGATGTSGAQTRRQRREDMEAASALRDRNSTPPRSREGGPARAGGGQKGRPQRPQAPTRRPTVGRDAPASSKGSSGGQGGGGARPNRQGGRPAPPPPRNSRSRPTQR